VIELRFFGGLSESEAAEACASRGGQLIELVFGGLTVAGDAEIQCVHKA
jgi:hypothetical protein